ncbi:hypothetical protein [Blastococcus brunescens]|uniref:Uncharacterized protein n=1 Tax=Blastococcus brunescens TaxID=1564165 RepID=A0ABZ1AWL6_9ACTN|nr:hypothetical protein [Blastococcus sp. BMG 8361]WRL62331.1 hypothetical protein U6N30_20155 [Blastococcus sp. BMG 8361]
MTGDVVLHDDLRVDGQRVAWWPAQDGDHVDSSPEGLGRALAWRAGAWSRRQALAEAFAFPDRALDLAAEDAIG